MSLIDRAIAELSPGWGRRRAQDRLALKVLAHYDAATTGNRGASWRRSFADADSASTNRQRLAFVGRDMVRNTPLALRAQTVICNNVIGDGIIWKLTGVSKTRADKLRGVLKLHFDTTRIDLDGRSNLYGLQRLAFNAVISDGEVLLRRVRTNQAVPFQIEVLEIDHLDTTKISIGNPNIRDGIEYNARGERVAYWIYDRHPGSQTRSLRGSYTSRRVPADEVIHIYRQDRPKQMRGVSWFAPVAMALQDLADGQDAQIMRQKIAACFAAFRVAPEADFTSTPPADGEAADVAGLSSMVPGRIQNLAPGEDIRFGNPPSVDGYDKFTRLVLQTVAAGMGITYEALSGDLSQVNFSSGRMGRLEMDRNVSAWQWLLLIPQMLQPIGQWTAEAMAMRPDGRGVLLDWVPPVRFIVDPNREISAMVASMDAGLSSRQGNIRSLGYDPEDVLAEQAEDMAAAAGNNMVFKSGPTVPVAPPVKPPVT